MGARWRMAGVVARESNSSVVAAVGEPEKKTTARDQQNSANTDAYQVRRQYCTLASKVCMHLELLCMYMHKLASEGQGWPTLAACCTLFIE